MMTTTPPTDLVRATMRFWVSGSSLIATDANKCRGQILFFHEFSYCFNVSVLHYCSLLKVISHRLFFEKGLRYSESKLQFEVEKLSVSGTFSLDYVDL